jgi:tetratricopeptide (TPR) repeat protein
MRSQVIHVDRISAMNTGHSGWRSIIGAILSVSSRFSLFRALAIVAFLGLAGCGSVEDRAQAHYERGMKLFEQRDYVKASLEFRNAVKLKKELVGAWRGLSQIEERNQNWEALTGILRTVVELDPADIETRLRLGRLMLLGNALDDALKLINGAGEAVDRHPGALAFKAAVFLKLNDPTGAVREARAALDIQPASVEATIVLAAERLARGDSEGALLILDRKEVAAANNIGIQIFKLLIFDRTGKVDQVEAALKKLVDEHPQEPVFRRQLVKFYVDQKRPDDAERAIRALADARPSDADAGMDVARFVNMVKGPAAARQELSARINAGGQVFEFQIALAELHVLEGNFADAVRLLETLSSNAGSRAQALTARVKLAEIQLSRRKADVAEELVAKVLREDSRNIGALKLRATIRIERGDLDAAVADLRQALNDQPRSAELMLLLSMAYERGGKIELADRQIADAMKVSGFDPTVGLAYIAFLQRRGSSARAEDVLTDLVGRRPGDMRLMAALANLRLARQNWTGAQEIADSIRRTNSNGSLLADQILAASLSGRAKFDDSISVLQSVHASAPNSSQPLVALVNTYIRAEKTDRAIAFLNTVIEKNPSNAEAYVLLGSSYLVNNAPDQAFKNYRAAIEQQPKNAVGYAALANLLVRQGKYDEATTTIRAGLKQQPDNAALHLALAGVFEITGAFEDAISQYEHILKEQPNSLVAANNLASLLSDHRSDKASLDRAYTLAAALRKSQVPQFKDTLGWVHHQRGEYRVAVSLLEEAVAELPNLALVRYHLGVSHAATGDATKAAEQLKKAFELASNDKELSEKIKAVLSRLGG